MLGHPYRHHQTLKFLSHMNYVQLLEDVKQEVTQFYLSKQNPNLTYHNLAHTQSVVSNAGAIGRHYQLNDKDFFIVTTAAWFHDVGYYLDGPNANEAKGHEERGAKKAAEFLQSKGIDAGTIEAVKQCILATIMPQHANDLLQQIVCDADLYHWGTDAFSDLNKQMRKESEWRHGKKIKKGDWRDGTIELLESHVYKTDYVRNLLSAKKQANIDKLKSKQEDADEVQVVVTPSPTGNGIIATPVPEITKIKKSKGDRPDRGIETMFRISSSNHQRLSDMADNKAHIMITTTSIIISVLLSVLLRKLEDNPHLTIPTLMLLVVCVVTMVFSILATRPTLPSGYFTPADIENKSVNLLFFGNFYKMDYDAFNGGMQAMMEDRDFLYGSLTRDVYSQGVVLGRKYKLLRLGYNIFMYGIIASVLAFVIASVAVGH